MKSPLHSLEDPTLDSDLLAEVLGCDSAAGREALLARACAGDPEMRGALESAIRDIEDGPGGGEIAARPERAFGAHISHLVARPGTRVGPFEVVEKIGEGGFGIVYRARQTAPVKREAALKLLRPGLDTLLIVKRFEQERQTLARLEHPGIAAFYDAGATEAGRPWFAMELIEGEPLTLFCDRRQLTVPERLRLFQKVCRAVHHAHLRGVIHRDLKPSNLLVRLGDTGEPEPKVIDFGVARALDADAQGATLMTRDGQLIGTPAYMSPEQASLNAGDVDTRADVYSLGAILYELLCGQPVLGPNEVAKMSITELQDAIRDRTPDRPSTRVRGLVAEQVERIVAARSGTLEDLRERLRGDLDWIVMKALEKDRERRYDTAQALRDDLSAFLEKRPVVARPPSFSYLAWRFTQRHRVAVSAGVAVLLSILAALAVSVTMYFREREARRRADLETAKTRQVARFLEDTLAAAGPEVAMGRDATLMKEVLRKTTDRLDTELGGQPEIEAEIRLIVGRTWKSLVEDTLAEEQIGRALALLRELHPGDHPDLARGIADHAEALIGLNRFRDAEPVAREGLEMWERLEGADHPEAGLSLNQIAFCLVKTGRPAEAEPIARRAYDLWRARPAESALEEAPNVYAIALMNQGRRDEAIGIYREQLAADRENLGAEHPQVVNILDNLGCTLAGARRDEEAEPILLEGVAMGRKFYEDRCPFEDHMLAALAGIAGRKGDLDGQLRYSREGAAVGARVYPPGHGYFLESQGQLARTLMAQAETRLDRAWTAKDEGEREKAKALLAELRNTEAFARIVKAEAAWIAALEALAARTEDAAEKLEIASARWKPNDPRAKRREVWLERLTQQG